MPPGPRVLGPGPGPPLESTWLLARLRPRDPVQLELALPDGGLRPAAPLREVAVARRAGEEVAAGEERRAAAVVPAREDAHDVVDAEPDGGPARAVPARDALAERAAGVELRARAIVVHGQGMDGGVDPVAERRPARAVPARDPARGAPARRR